MDPQEESARNGEIVGLHSPTHGRSCELHAVSGREVKVGSLVRLTRKVIMVDREQGVEGAEVDDAAPQGLALRL